MKRYEALRLELLEISGTFRHLTALDIDALWPFCLYAWMFDL